MAVNKRVDWPTSSFLLSHPGSLKVTLRISTCVLVVSGDQRVWLLFVSPSYYWN